MRLREDVAVTMHATLYFKPNYYDQRMIPIGVALWDDRYVGFRGLSEGERLRGLDPDQIALARMSIEQIEGFMRRGLPHGERLRPQDDAWWDVLARILVHSTRLSEPRAIDVPAGDPWLDRLYETALRPFRIPAVIPEAAETRMYAELTPGGYRHVYLSRAAVDMCSPRGPVHPVRVRRDEAEAGTHHGWWDAETQRFSLVWESALQLGMCFPYGVAAEEARGKGLACRLAVERREESDG